MDNKEEKLVELEPLNPADMENSNFDISMTIILILVYALIMFLPSLLR